MISKGGFSLKAEFEVVRFNATDIVTTSGEDECVKIFPDDVL